MKITNFIKRSIKSKLIFLFLLVSIVPILIIGIIGYSSSEKALHSAIISNISSVVNSRANHISNFITVSGDVINSASSLSIFRDNLYNIERGINVKSSTDALETAMEDWKSNSNVFYRAKILNKKGIVIATTKSVYKDIGIDKSDNAYFSEGLKGPYITDPYISPDDNVPNIAYSCPVYAAGSKTEIVGVLVIHQSTDAIINKASNVAGTGIGINDITTNTEGMGETGETYLVNKEGLIISTSRFVDTIFLNRKVANTIIRQLLSDVVSENYLDYRGIPTIGQAHSIPGTSWVLIGEFDYAEAMAPVKQLGFNIGLSGVVILMFVLLLAYLIAQYFTKPIVHLSKVAGAVALGDLDSKIDVSFTDEIGELAESFKVVQSTLREKSEQAKEISNGNLLLDIKPLSDRDSMGISFQTMVKKLREQLSEINEGVNILASSSSEIMAAVTQLAASSAETATSVGETTTTVEEVKQISEISSFKAKEVSDNSTRIKAISKDGINAIANTIEGMNRIKQQMGYVASMVVKLSEQSQTIGEITATVSELAEQSNLLAVNAAIEAAKAGEQGKGFTVVAQEIRMLAERSKEATSLVRNILRDIQKSISSAVMATEEGGKAVEEGLRLTMITGDAINVLSESVAEAANAAIQITASSQQQLEGMDQVVAAMENIKEASMQAASSTQQSVESVNELQKVGQKLDILMKLYKLEK